MENFRTRTINQIRLWAWAAAVLPISALAGIFFIWKFYDNTILSFIMITGETAMFTIAVIWWWWAMYTMRNLVKQWDETKVKVGEVLSDVKDLKVVILEVFKEDKDK